MSEIVSGVAALDLSTPESSVREVKFKFGQYTYSCLTSTILKHENSTLAEIVTSLSNSSAEAIEIDRDGTLFPAILDYVRDSTLDMNWFSQPQVKALREEAVFYRLPGLIEFCDDCYQTQISDLGVETVLPDLSIAELERLLETSKHPVVIVSFCEYREAEDLDDAVHRMFKLCADYKYSAYHCRYFFEADLRIWGYVRNAFTALYMPGEARPTDFEKFQSSGDKEEKVRGMLLKLNKFMGWFDWYAKKSATEKSNNRPPGDVTFKFGHSTFSCLASTILKHEDSVLAKCLTARGELQDEAIEIDRDGTHFPAILDYMRDHTLDMDWFSLAQMEALREEADFYNLPDLIELCDWYCWLTRHLELVLPNGSLLKILPKVKRPVVVVNFHLYRRLSELDEAVEEIFRVCEDRNYLAYYLKSWYVADLRLTNTITDNIHEESELYVIALYLPEQNSFPLIIKRPSDCEDEAESITDLKIKLNEFKVELQTLP